MFDIRKSLLYILLFFSLCLIPACKKPVEEGKPIAPLQLSSPVISEGQPVPTKHTCDGEDLSPALLWSGTPQSTQSFALIMDDPDAPAGTFVHWVLYDIPASRADLPGGVANTDTVEGIGTQGKNSARKTGYMGPCPPKGPAHRYYFKLYALDTLLNLKTGASKAEVENAMQGHILAQGQLMGTYSR